MVGKAIQQAEADAPTAKRGRNDFFQINSEGEKLFSVNKGVNAQSAMGVCSCFLTTAASLAETIGMLSDDEINPNNPLDIRQVAWAVNYLIKFSQGITEALEPCS